MNRSTACAVLLVAIGVMSSSEQTRAEDRTKEALHSISLEFQIKGAELKARMKKLTTELDWHRSMQPAYAEARRTGKPIFLVQALGSLDGLL